MISLFSRILHLRFLGGLLAIVHEGCGRHQVPIQREPSQMNALSSCLLGG